jgi:peroxiredoxin
MDGFAVVARIMLVGVFAVSGIAKLFDRDGTRRAVQGFGLPDSLVGPVALTLPLAEIAIAGALVPGTSARAGAVAAIALLAAFMIGISINLAQGRRPDCNCFGQLHSAPVGPTTLVRNVFLGAVAGVVAFGAGPDAGGSVIDAIGELDGTGLVLAGIAVAAIAAALVLLGRRGRTIITGAPPEADAAAQQPVGPPVGSAAPRFSLARPSGETVTLSDLLARGKRVLLVFFSPSCGPCVRIAPELARWQREFADTLTVAVLSSGARESVLESATKYEITDVLVDERGEVAKSYGSRGTPGAVLIDPSGAVASAHASGDGAISDLLIDAFGLTEVVAAVAAEEEARLETSHDHGVHAGHDHEEHATSASPAADLLDPQMIAGTFVPVGRSDVSIVERDGELVLVDPLTGAVHVLNPTAAIVWQCLDGSGSVDEIGIDIADVFEQGQREVQEAVLEVVRRFGRQGLLQGVGISREEKAPAQPAP